MSSVAVVLPLVAIGLLWWLTTVHRGVLGLARLSAAGTFVVAFVAFEAVLVGLSELSSVGRHLTATTVVVVWTIVVVALALVLVRTVGWASIRRSVRRPVAVREWIAAHPWETIGLVTLGLIVLVLAVVSVMYLPNNTDSLVYHLPRVTEWIQQSSVEHFATHYTAQIEFSPLHEFNVLHTQLLSGTDRLGAYPQLLAFVVCAAGAAEVARLLGGSRGTQVGSALIWAIVPSAVLQATSTQNDVFAAAVGVSMFVLLLAWVPLGRWVLPALALGLAVGLAAIVKGILPPLVAPALALLAARQVLVEAKASSWKRALGRAGAVAAVVLLAAALVAGPFFKRNHDVFDSFTGPVSDSTVNEVFSRRASIGNVIRATAVNFRVGGGRPGPDTLVQEAVLGGLRELYEAVGASQQDPRFVIGALDDAFKTGDFRDLSRYEEYGANAWHVLLVVATCALLAWWCMRGERWARLPALMAVGLTIGYVAFFATARWSLFVARYQLPLLVLWAPLIALALAHLHRYVLRGVVAVLVVAVVPQLLDNATRSLIHPTFASDDEPYFIHPGGDGFFVAPEDYDAAIEAIAESGCDRLGIGNWILLEYPVWAGLDAAGWEGTIEHVDVDNASGELGTENFAPCAVLRQVIGRPSEVVPAGWAEVPFGDLSLTVPQRG